MGWKVTTLSSLGQTPQDIQEASGNPLRKGQCYVYVEYSFFTAYGNLIQEAKIKIRPFLDSREKAGRVTMLVQKTQLR